ncbi:hypothetical protein PG997_011855 [Apiospora hydei]|uniref:Uncharacterized protein n=1 Tax=Apiospora hydei TaxID=1337664 RepID=A0ABR1V1S2_9PEZI
MKPSVAFTLLGALSSMVSGYHIDICYQAGLRHYKVHEHCCTFNRGEWSVFACAGVSNGSPMSPAGNVVKNTSDGGFRCKVASAKREEELASS